VALACFAAVGGLVCRQTSEQFLKFSKKILKTARSFIVLLEALAAKNAHGQLPYYN
jgi:hypothetical protein